MKINQDTTAKDYLIKLAEAQRDLVAGKEQELVEINKIYKAKKDNERLVGETEILDIQDRQSASGAVGDVSASEAMMAQEVIADLRRQVSEFESHVRARDQAVAAAVAVPRAIPRARVAGRARRGRAGGRGRRPPSPLAGNGLCVFAAAAVAAVLV